LVSINGLADLIMDIAGVKLVKKHVEGPEGVRGRNSDNSLLKKVLTWEPKVSLESGLMHTYEWIENQVKANIEYSAVNI
jgi:GDP-D-mannose 3',5'-epimerase